MEEAAIQMANQICQIHIEGGKINPESRKRRCNSKYRTYHNRNKNYRNCNKNQCSGNENYRSSNSKNCSRKIVSGYIDKGHSTPTVKLHREENDKFKLLDPDNLGEPKDNAIIHLALHNKESSQNDKPLTMYESDPSMKHVVSIKMSDAASIGIKQQRQRPNDRVRRNILIPDVATTREEESLLEDQFIYATTNLKRSSSETHIYGMRTNLLTDEDTTSSSNSVTSSTYDLNVHHDDYDNDNSDDNLDVENIYDHITPDSNVVYGTMQPMPALEPSAPPLQEEQQQ
ncbi:hypothetical protein GE061_020277 [Apolygus lucorum]|uniref:Uncharacterized protein n=1 Tax=Apolygus lucorum TaxID=248454 RepID=A0A8S9WIY0_APOLU|nr:hypothetical protein GE061_020277 [Apolygus lucorum]